MYQESLPPLETPLSSLELLPIHPTDSSTDWYPDVSVPPYIPNSPDPTIQDTPYVPSSPKPDMLEEISFQVCVLEDWIEVTNLEFREKLCEIEAQVFADGCLLTELKWKEAEIRDIESQLWLMRKKTYRRNPQSLLSHHYPTRYSNALAENQEESKQEAGRMGERIRRVEGRVDDAKSEIRLMDRRSARRWHSS